MRELRIGQIVSFNCVSVAEYDAQDNRRIEQRKVKTLVGQVVGRAQKFEGKYCGGSTSYWGDGDYDPAYLSVSRAVQLWEVRTGWRNKPVLVADEHCVPCDDDCMIAPGVKARDFKLPYQGPLPIEQVTTLAYYDPSHFCKCSTA